MGVYETNIFTCGKCNSKVSSLIDGLCINCYNQWLCELNKAKEKLETISKHDYFIGQALSALITKDNYSFERKVELSIRFADEVIRQLKESENET